MKIAILIPHLRQVEAKFAVSLSALTYMVGRTRPDLELQVFSFSSSNLAFSRSRLAVNAFRWGSDYLFWLDSDMVFLPNALETLLAHGKDVVGANYLRRSVETGPIAVLDGKLQDSTPEKAKAGLERTDSLGFGVLLMKALPIRAMGFPLFGIEADEGGVNFEGEDRFFFRRLKEAGIEAWLDHSLSMQVGHITETVLRFPP